MGSQTIYHKSKVADIVMNFAASENNLSWSFTAENDGEIYEDVKTNVASYTINGGAVTLPFALVGGSSYSVAITKITNGQTAYISLRTRRAIDKSVNISVPDFGAYDGRYLYVLLNNNTVKKFDSQLLLPSNYAGSGVWTVDPVVATITLPTLPNSAFYSKIKFVTYNNIQRLLVMSSGVNPGTNFYFSYINVIDDTVTDLSGNSNTYSSFLIHGSNQFGTFIYCTYDFIRHYLYIITSSGAQGATSRMLNLANNSLNTSSYSYTGDPSNVLEKQFSPVDLQFITVGDYDPSIPRVFNHKLFGNNSGVWGYRYRTNQRLCSGDTFGKLSFFNSFGILLGGVNYGTVGGFAVSELYGFDRANTVFMTYINSYSIVNLTSASSKYRTTDKNLASPNNNLLNLRNCHYSNLYVAFCGTSARSISTRMLIFKESETNADFGYYDFANTVYSADANQLLI